MAGPFAIDDEWQRHEQVATKGGPRNATDAAIGTVSRFGTCVAIAADGDVRCHSLDGEVISLPPIDPSATTVAMGTIAERSMLIVGTQAGRLSVYDLDAMTRVASFSLDEPIFRLGVDSPTEHVYVETSSHSNFTFELANPR